MAAKFPQYPSSVYVNKIYFYNNDRHTSTLVLFTNKACIYHVINATIQSLMAIYKK